MLIQNFIIRQNKLSAIKKISMWEPKEVVIHVDWGMRKGFE